MEMGIDGGNLQDDAPDRFSRAAVWVRQVSLKNVYNNLKSSGQNIDIKKNKSS